MTFGVDEETDTYIVFQDRRGTFFPWVAWTFVVMMYEALAVLLYFTTSKHKQKVT